MRRLAVPLYTSVKIRLLISVTPEFSMALPVGSLQRTFEVGSLRIIAHGHVGKARGFSDDVAVAVILTAQLAFRPFQLWPSRR